MCMVWETIISGSIAYICAIALWHERFFFNVSSIGLFVTYGLVDPIVYLA